MSPVIPPADGDKPVEQPKASFKVGIISPENALRSGDNAVIRVTVTPQNGFSGNVTAELVDAPVGVSAQPVTATVGGATELKITVKLGTAAGLLKLPIRVTGGTISQREDAFAFVYRVSTLPSGALDCPYPTCRFPAGPSAFVDGVYWVAGSNGSNANSTLVGVSARDGKTQTHDLGLERGNADYYDYGLAVASGKIWLGISHFSTVAYLLGFDPVSGTRTQIEVGERNGRIINVVSLPDGRIAFLFRPDYQPEAQAWSIGVYDPASNVLKLTPITAPGNTLFALKVAPDGALWTTENYTSPALVRFDPTTFTTRKFSIGKERANLALNIAPTDDGKIWYLDSWANTLNILNPMDGSVKSFNKYYNSGQLYSFGDSVFLINNDPSIKGVELLVSDGEELVSLPFPSALGVNNDLDGFIVSPEGDLAYESSGEIYILPITQ
ncbi:hypothetical protein [Deinococcus humi]|uniref:SbsA Ig-like domain-containing protein n=1 Tax=Deinococcus humi TaxID=662880 RepID=A0A7W8JXL3_9DEIO|nr:hypothetical protein [Deinococcus humi]MBB5363828.1 hypothetical protein [Deinococcus humi]GGO31822.1 hypothetical protein GCM10008949_28440 [Deinococcus humi]